MKKLIYFTAFCSFFLIQKAFSQQADYLSIQYSVSFATGDMGDFISSPSFRGGIVEWRKGISDNVLAGVDLGWYVFYERKDYDTYTIGSESFSGIQYRYQNEVPILISVDYLISPENTLKPYVGLGIGTMYTERNTQMGQFYIEENPWHFAIRPEAGLLYELSFNTLLKVAAKYYSGFSAGDLSSQGFFSISGGIAFHL